MDIECPDHAIAIWLEGDQIMVRFPDRQLVHIHRDEFPRLITIMRHRAAFAARGHRPSVGTEAAPVQYDIDAMARAVRTREELEAQAVRRREREAKALMRRVERRQAAEQADELLAIVGL